MNVNKWIPCHQHSHLSLLDGLSKPQQIADRCSKLGYTSAAITDHGNLAASPSFVKACKSKNIKPILGCEFYLSQQDATIRDKSNSQHSHLCVLAKNLDGWRNLIAASSASNRPENFYRKPRLSLDQLSCFAANKTLIAFSGHPGSDLGNVFFHDFRAAYAASTYEEARSLLRDDWKNVATQLAGKYQDIFGKDNFRLEIQLIDEVNIPATKVIAHGLRIISKKTGIPCMATGDSHYPTKESAADQRILLCSAFETTLNEIKRRISNDEDITLGAFFKSNRYHIPSIEELEGLHTPEELSNTLLIAEMCENYDILSKPVLPHFDCPEKTESSEYLRQLCRQGWQKKVEGKIPKSKHPEYAERVKYELSVITEAGLSSYFLVVQDFVNWARGQGWKVGRGRGSGAGCIVSYLIGITSVDPVEYGLLFERFYNAGRNSPGRISLPDIDCDFPVGKREQVKQYIRNKYGEDKVADMITFGRMQGRGAIKDVLRAHEKCSFDEMNRITEHIPDESKISDKLQEMKEETGEASIIRWSLENNGDKLKEWCSLKDDGTLEGPMAFEFAQAIRLEGTKRSQGKHASGLVISPYNLSSVVPMVYDKSTDKMMVGVEMNDAEAMGLPKFDILGINTLNKIQSALNIIQTGKLDD